MKIQNILPILMPALLVLAGCSSTPLPCALVICPSYCDSENSKPKKPKATTEVESSQGGHLMVGDMQFTIEKNGTEKVCFALSRFCAPELFSLGDDYPMVVIEFNDVPSWNGISTISDKASLIKQVRTYPDPTHNKLRIVLELEPFLGYVIEPFFSKSEHLYCVSVAKK